MNKEHNLLKTKIYHLFLLFIVSSILGYIYECITTFFKTGIFYKDTGFSCLPILPIYGFGMLIIYFLFGTPDRMRILHKPIFTKETGKDKVLSYISYFLITAFTATIFEIVIGLLFEYGFGQILWDYTGLPFTFTKYACLQISILWGLGATLLMKCLYTPLEKLALSIPEKKLVSMVNGFLFVWILDIVFNFGYFYTTGVMFSILNLI